VNGLPLRIGQIDQVATAIPGGADVKLDLLAIVDAGSSERGQGRLHRRFRHAHFLGTPVRRPQPVLEAGRIHAPHFAPTRHGNHGHRIAVGIVVQLALRSGQRYQFIKRARVVIAAGQFIAHQLVEHRHRAIAIGLLGGVAQAQVGRQVRGLEDREGAHHVVLGQHAHVIGQTDQCRLDHTNGIGVRCRCLRYRCIHRDRVMVVMVVTVVLYDSVWGGDECAHHHPRSTPSEVRSTRRLLASSQASTSALR